MPARALGRAQDRIAGWRVSIPCQQTNTAKESTMHRLCRPRALFTLLGSTVATAAVSLCLIWPQSTRAEGSGGPPQPVSPGARLGKVLVEGKLRRDPGSQHGWSVDVTATNPSDQEQACRLVASIMQSRSNPMSRVAARPIVSWEHEEKLLLSANQKLHKSFAVPAELAAALTANESRQAGATRANPVATAPRTSYWVLVHQPES
jgi:hypothetical protein